MWLLENAMDGIERLFCSTKQAKTYTSTDKEHFVHYNNIFWCYMVEYSSLTANIHYNKKDLGQNISQFPISQCLFQNCFPMLKQKNLPV